MSDKFESFNILYASGSDIDPMMLKFGGEPGASAQKTIADALARSGRAADGDCSHLILSPADMSGNGADYAPDTQFLILEGSETLHDLRLIIGSDDTKVLLRQGGWGGDGPEFFIWAVNDFLPVARNLVEAYGVIEVMRVTGRAIEARRHRETRKQAEDWVRAGYGSVTGLLRDQATQYDVWTVSSLRKEFGLNDGDAGLLMKHCGYKYERATSTYHKAETHGGLD